MKKVSFFLIVFFSQMFLVSVAHATDYDCADFGTRERAQHEYEMGKRNKEGWTIRSDFDKYGLDRDSNGEACEWNPSSKTGMAVLSGIGLLVGFFLAKSESKEKFTVKNFFSEEAIFLSACFWWIPYLVMTMSRNNVFSPQTTPLTLYICSLVFAGGLSFLLKTVLIKRSRT